MDKLPLNHPTLVLFEDQHEQIVVCLSFDRIMLSFPCK